MIVEVQTIEFFLETYHLNEMHPAAHLSLGHTFDRDVTNVHCPQTSIHQPYTGTTNGFFRYNESVVIG